MLNRPQLNKEGNLKMKLRSICLVGAKQWEDRWLQFASRKPAVPNLYQRILTRFMRLIRQVQEL